MKNDVAKKQITLEEITRQKKEVLRLINIEKELIHATTSKLFAPVKSTNRIETLMNSVNSGMAAFDGIMTGIKIMRHVRSIFRRRK